MANWQEQQRRIAQQQEDERRQQAERDRQQRHQQEQERAHHRHLGKEGVRTSHPANQATYRAHQDKLAKARSNSSCFPGDVRVLTIDGWRRLDALDASDTVVSYGPDGRSVARPVYRLRRYPLARIWEIALADGTCVRATRHHRFLTARGWRTLRRLHGDDVLLTGRGPVAIARITDTGRNQEVFNLIVAAPHTYVVEGCVVHSFSSFSRLQALAFAIVGWLRTGQCRRAPDQCTS